MDLFICKTDKQAIYYAIMLLQADDIDKHVCGESDTDMIYYLQVVCTGLYLV